MTNYYYTRTMLLSMIVILVLTRLSNCTDSAGTNLVFVEYDDYDAVDEGPYLKTGVLEGRPVYCTTIQIQNIRSSSEIISGSSLLVVIGG